MNAYRDLHALFGGARAGSRSRPPLRRSLRRIERSIGSRAKDPSGSPGCNQIPYLLYATAYLPERLVMNPQDPWNECRQRLLDGSPARGGPREERIQKSNTQSGAPPVYRRHPS